MQRRSAPYTAMSLNERLSLAGLTRVFDAAARERNREGMLELLARVAMPPEQAEATAESILKNPRHYGY